VISRHRFALAPGRDDLEQHQLLLAPDERSGAFRSPHGRLRGNGASLPGGDRRGLPFRFHVPARAVEDYAARGGVRTIAEQDLAGASVLLEPGGYVDRVAAHHQLSARRRLAARDDLAGVYPRA
jgi:hypothetical protein